MRLNRVLTLFAMAVATGVALIWVEGQNFRLQQKLAEIHAQREKLAEEQARLRLTIGRFAAPAQLMESVREADESLAPPHSPTVEGSRGSMQPYLQR